MQLPAPTVVAAQQVIRARRAQERAVERVSGGEVFGPEGAQQRVVVGVGEFVMADPGRGFMMIEHRLPVVEDLQPKLAKAEAEVGIVEADRETLVEAADALEHLTAE